jgi:NAD(P)-dependent dehydrogenase (short-subunit alcohol dehydrogenase family)
VYARHQAPYCVSKVAMLRLLDHVQAEYPKMRVFSLSPGTVREGTVPKPFLVYANDKAILSGGVSLWLSHDKADFLKGRFLNVNWDVEELVQHKEEIERKDLLKSKTIIGEFGPEGYPWES